MSNRRLRKPRAPSPPSARSCGPSPTIHDGSIPPDGDGEYNLGAIRARIEEERAARATGYRAGDLLPANEVPSPPAHMRPQRTRDEDRAPRAPRARRPPDVGQGLPEGAHRDGETFATKPHGSG